MFAEPRPVTAEGRWRCARHSKITRMRTAQNLVYVAGRIVVALVMTGAQRHQPAGCNIFHVAVERGQHPLCGRGGERRALRIDKTIDRVDDGSGPERDGLVECSVDVFGLANVEGLDFDAKSD